MSLQKSLSNIKNKWRDVRGKLTPMVAMDKLTWFGVGGPTEWLFEPADIQDLTFFLRNYPKEMPKNDNIRRRF